MDERARGRDVWVYRDGRRRESGADALRRLLDAFETVSRATDDRRRASAVQAAVLSGELEAALADAEHDAQLVVARVTDALAAIALGSTANPRSVLSALDALDVPEVVTIGAPEGLAYYAVHPEAFAIAARRVVGAGPPRRILVVGVRSIGTTLSAFARAGLRGHARDVERITVRPSGPPFDRRLLTSSAERTAFARAKDEEATVLVVDEGPGMSGSTLLAVVDAIERSGVPRCRVSVLCTRPVDPRRLVATNAASRWRALDIVVVPSDVRAPAVEDGRDLSGGAWRAHFWEDERDWPAVFASAERRKVLVGGGASLVKYEGLGSAAARARDRASLLAAANLTPALEDRGDGWASSRFAGRPLTRGDASDAVLRHLAVYCALRATLCAADEPAQPLEPMVEKNLGVVLGRGVRPPQLPIVRPVIVDGRMHPHEWIRGARCGRGSALLKTDAIAHGDDHFFPGPTDIAWDLAGIIVEWRLDERAKAKLLTEFAVASGDPTSGPTERIEAWTCAYASFRAALTLLALEQASDASEVDRLMRDLAHYRERLASTARA